METEHIGGVCFKRRKLQALGEHWEPDAPVDLQSFTQQNIQEVTAAARELSLIVIGNTTTSEDQTWRDIRPATADGSTKIPHAEYLGKVDLLLWKLRGENRAPTGFVSESVYRDGMKENADLLQLPKTGIKQSDTFIGNLESFRNSLLKPASAVDVNTPHSMFWHIRRDELVDAEIAKHHVQTYLYEEIWRNTFGKNAAQRRETESQLETTSRELVRTKIMFFNEMVMQTIADDVQHVEWSQEPNAGAIVWNRLGEEADAALHFGVPSADSSAQDTLLRTEVFDNEVKLARPVKDAA